MFSIKFFFSFWFSRSFLCPKLLIRWSKSWFLFRYIWNLSIAFLLSSYNSSFRRLVAAFGLFTLLAFFCAFIFSYFYYLSYYISSFAAFSSTFFMNRYILSYCSLEGTIPSSEDSDFSYFFLALFIYSSFFILSISLRSFSTLSLSRSFFSRQLRQKKESSGTVSRGGVKQYI